MRRAAIVAASAVGGALLGPAAPLAADEPAPSAAIEASANPVAAGSPLRLDSSRSTAAAGTIVGHRWDLDGDGSFETDTGSLAVTETTPAAPGKLTVHLRVVDERGKTGEAALDVNVTPAAPAAGDGTAQPPAKPGDAAPAPAPAPAPSPAPGPAASPAPGSAASPAPAAGDPAPPAGDPAQAAGDPAAAAGTAPAGTAPAAEQPAAPAPKPARRHTASAAQKRKAGPQVHAAAATGVTIKNFKFAPASISVNVGDTITWSNQDEAPHTATANDGSFDTGNLNKGQSGSHTFAKAGTFAYICSVHPSMKGTVVVAAASGGSGGGSGSAGSGGDSTGTATPSTAAPSAGGLPQTGLNLLPVVLLAMLLTGSGTLLRRLARDR
jgi:plastocyanin